MDTYKYRNVSQTYAHAYLRKVCKNILNGIKNCGDKDRKISVLEIGCGNGEFCDFISGLGFEVCGTDISETGIALAKNNFPKINFLKKDIYDLKAADFQGRFDIIISLETIEHLLLPKVLIRKAKELLKPQGYLIISTPYHGYFKNLLISIFNMWDRHFCVGWDLGHAKFFSVNSLDKLLQAEGFTGNKFIFAGRCWPLWKSMVCINQLAGGSVLR